MNTSALLTQIEEGHTHAYIVEGAFPNATEGILRSLHERGENFFLVERDILRIEDVRELRTQATRKQDARTFFIFRAHTMLQEAQNALLKALEEPSEGIVYLIHLRTSYALIPTLVSRCQRLFADTIHTDTGTAQHFLSASPSKRLALIAAAMDTDGHTDAYALVRALAFVPALSVREYEMIVSANKAANRHPLGLKQLLEHLALTLPKH